MASLLSFTKIAPTEDIFSYAQAHAQNEFVLTSVREFIASPQSEFLVILPSEDSFSQQEIPNLSFGWRIFPPNSTDRNTSRSELIVTVIKHFLSLSNTHVCLFPSEFSLDSEFQRDKPDRALLIAGYPYLYGDNTSSVTQLSNFQNASRGYLYNSLLIEADTDPVFRQQWFDTESSTGNLKMHIRCIVMEAYDGDSFLLIVPECGKHTMDAVFRTVAAR